MVDHVEVAVTSDASGQLWNACVWDAHAGTCLMTYKGGISAPHTLSFIGGDYLIAAEKTKSLLHVWALNRDEQMQIRMVCPGYISALSVSPDGSYCVGAVEEKLHVWQVSSGRLLAVATRHYQRVTCIRFTDDGSHFASAGEDGMLLFWPLSYLVTQATDLTLSVVGQPDPRYAWSHHSLSVSDIYIGRGGLRARLASVSLDQTCKLYELASGTLLLSIIFDVGLTAVTMDPLETSVFAGGTDGNIYQINLLSPPRTQEYHLSSKDKGMVFVGHTKAVTCLSVSLDGLTLLSGSNDSQVMLWHIPSRQSIRTLPHKGPITNAFLTIAPKHVFSENLDRTIVLHSFQRQMDVRDGDNYNIEVMVDEKVDLGPGVATGSHVSDSPVPFAEIQVPDSTSREEIGKLKSINSDLFHYAIENLFEPYEKMAKKASKNSFRKGLKNKFKRKKMQKVSGQHQQDQK